MAQSVAEYETHWIEAYFYVMFYKTFHMQHICLDEIGKPASPASPDLGAAQGSMDQSVHSSAKVLLRRCFSAVSIQKWNHPNVVVVLDCLHCLLSIQWFYIVLQLIMPEHQSAKLPDVWGKGRFEGCALQFGSCTQWMNLLCSRIERSVEEGYFGVKFCACQHSC